MSGGGARTRVKMRERAINVKSRLVLRETPDLGADEDDDQTQDEAGTSAAASVVNNSSAAASMHVMAVEPSFQPIDGEIDETIVEIADHPMGSEIPSKKHQKSATAIAAATATNIRASKQVTEEEKEKHKKAKVEMSMIPTPPIFEDSEYEKQHFLPWRPPESLIKFVANTGSELNTMFDFYELRQDDLVWLRSYNDITKPSRAVAEEQMESLLDMFEKEASYRSKLIDPAGDFPCSAAKAKARELLQLTGSFVEHIYEYWRARRKMLRKALMRKFQTPPLEPGPHVAFVPRVPSRRASSRNPRRNDASSFRKLQHLKEDFGRVLDIIAKLKKREVIKRHLLQVQVEEFDAALERTPFAAQLSTEREQANKRRIEEREAFEEKKRQKVAERAVRPALPVDEHVEFPGYFLGPFFTFPEAYSVELQKCDPTKTERENCALLFVSNIPRSNYVAPEENEVEVEGGERKENRLKRTKTPRGGKSGSSTPTLTHNNSHHSNSAHTLVLPRSAVRVKKSVDATKHASASSTAVSSAHSSSNSSCISSGSVGNGVIVSGSGTELGASVVAESSSSESEDWEEDRQSEDEYYSALENYLVQHGRNPHCMSSFLSRAFDDISLSVPPLEKLQRGNSLAPMDESTDSSAPSHVTGHQQHRTLQNFPWSAPVKSFTPTVLAPVVDPEEELRRLEQLDNYRGYCRGRVSRCGRTFFDIRWKPGQAEPDPSSASEDDVEDINLDSIDECFRLHNGVVGKEEPPLIVRSVETFILPE